MQSSILCSSSIGDILDGFDRLSFWKWLVPTALGSQVGMYRCSLRNKLSLVNRRLTFRICSVCKKEREVKKNQLTTTMNNRKTLKKKENRCRPTGTHRHTVLERETLQRVCGRDNMFNVVIAANKVSVVANATVFPQRFGVVAYAYPLVHWLLWPLTQTSLHNYSTLQCTGFFSKCDLVRLRTTTITPSTTVRVSGKHRKTKKRKI